MTTRKLHMGKQQGTGDKSAKWPSIEPHAEKMPTLVGDMEKTRVMSCALPLSSYIEAMSVAAIVFAVYLRTLAPGIPGGDSGELVAEACQAGIAHPPGYPLLTLLLGGLYRALSMEQGFAFAANVFSAACSSGASFFIFVSILLLCQQPTSLFARASAATASMCFSFSPLIWLYSTGIEVFSLNNLFAALLVFLLLRFLLEQSIQNGLTGAFFCGLALTNQHTIILFIAPIVLTVFWKLRKCMTPRVFAALSGSFSMGMLPYIYLFIAAKFAPKPGAWGDTGTLGGLLHHFRRGDYGTFKLFAGAGDAEGLLERLRLYFIDLVTYELCYVGFVFVVVGVVDHVRTSFSAHNTYSRMSKMNKSLQRKLKNKVEKAKKRRVADAGGGGMDEGQTHGQPYGQTHEQAPEHRKRQEQCRGVVPTSKNLYSFDEAEYNKFKMNAFWALWGMFWCYQVVFHSLSNMPLSDALLYGVHRRFWQQPNILVFVYFGVGLERCFSLLHERLNAHQAVTALALLASVVLAAGQCALWFSLNDQSSNWFMTQYARSLVAGIPQDAVYFSNYDMQWTALRYLQKCENFRPDLTFINLSMMSFAWFGKQTILFPRLNFPGTHLVAASTQNSTGFSMLDLFEANRQLILDGPGIFVSGRLLYGDHEIAGRYDMIAVGMVLKVVPDADREVHYPLSLWEAQSKAAWEKVNAVLPELPPEDKYDAETWEYTIARDHGMRRADRVTYLLQQITQQERARLPQLAEVAAVLEDIYLNEPPKYLPLHTLKNLGLAYAHMARSDEEPEDGEQILLPHVGQGAEHLGWRGRSAIRLIQVWSKWMELPHAKTDDGFNTVKKTVESLNKIYKIL